MVCKSRRKLDVMKTFLLVGGLALAFFSTQLIAQCTRDIECRGNRLCEKGVCVWPPAKPPSSPATASTPVAPATTAATPAFADYRVTFVNQSFTPRFPPTGNKWMDERFAIVGQVQPNFAGRFYFATGGCGTSCRLYRLFDLVTGKEYPVPFGGEQETKAGESYTTFLEFEKDSMLIRAIYASGRECRQRFFLFREGKLSSVSQTTRTKHDFCS